MLETLSFDCYNADVFTSGLGGSTNLDRWQLAVDTIWRFYKCGLIWSPVSVGSDECISETEWLAYINELRLADPIEGSYDDFGVWKQREICAFDRVFQIIERFKLKRENKTRRSEFAAFIAQMYCNNGVPWRSDPLLPIRIIPSG